REQFQELDRSDFSFESNLNARFLSSHSLKACTFSISNSLKSFTCKVLVFIQPPLRKSVMQIKLGNFEVLRTRLPNFICLFIAA
ncbi:hypothetical protein, partial [Nodularia spumigena]|uniref:hypothetical protein n=1 Tax=Nodularia spumigena TaxID=70799 RepID=UPI00232FC1E3